MWLVYGTLAFVVVAVIAIHDRAVEQEERLDNLADQIQDLTDKIAAVETAEAALKQRVSDQQTALQGVIDDLKAHPVAPDISALLIRLDAVAADMATVDAPPAG